MATTSTAVLKVEFGDKVQRRLFEPVRQLLHVEQDDRMQEGIGMTWEQYLGKEEKTGEVMDDALLVHVCRQKATDFSRHLVRRTHTLRDASDPRNYHLGRTELLHLDGLPDEDGAYRAEGDTSIQLGLALHLSENPVEKLVSAIDLLDWLRSMEPEDLELLGLRQYGFTLEEIAKASGCSTTQVFSRLKALGLALADRAGIATTKKARKHRTDAAQMESDHYDA